MWKIDQQMKILPWLSDLCTQRTFLDFFCFNDFLRFSLLFETSFISFGFISFGFIFCELKIGKIITG